MGNKVSSRIAVRVPNGTLSAPAPTRNTSLQLAAPAPNPFRGQTRLQFTLPESRRVDVAVFDAAGRRITTLASGLYEAGTHSVTWRGVDSSGRNVTPGLYFVTLQSNNDRVTQKVLRLE